MMKDLAGGKPLGQNDEGSCVYKLRWIINWRAAGRVGEANYRQKTSWAEL
jgi:hypothetical protein